jgi:hypothetical protein
MPLRGFGSVTLAGTAQPLFGTTTTAVINPTPDPHTGFFDPRSQASTGTVAITSIQYFRVGDYIVVGPAGGPYDSASITSITVGSSPAGTIGVKGLTKSHASGEWVILCKPCAAVTVTFNTTTAILYIAEDNTVASTSLTLIDQIPAQAATSTYHWQYGASNIVNALDTSHLWVLGTGAIIPSLLLI